jgi:hypothetical protein
MSTPNDPESYTARVAEFHAARRGAQAGMKVRHSYDIYFEGTLPSGRRPNPRNLREPHPGCYILRHFSIAGPLCTAEDFTAAIGKTIPRMTVTRLVKATQRHTGEVWTFDAPSTGNSDEGSGVGESDITRRGRAC